MHATRRECTPLRVFCDGSPGEAVELGDRNVFTWMKDTIVVDFGKKYLLVRLETWVKIKSSDNNRIIPILATYGFAPTSYPSKSVMMVE